MMPYSVVYYHIVWGTYFRQPTIIPQIEKLIFATVQAKSKDLKSPIHGLNGTTDHIHIAVSVAVAISVAEWVRQIKGISSFTVNKTFPDVTPKFSWQQSYGVQTFGSKALGDVLSYIKHQKERHRTNNLIAGLERSDDD